MKELKKQQQHSLEAAKALEAQMVRSPQQAPVAGQGRAGAQASTGLSRLAPVVTTGTTVAPPPSRLLCS